MSFYHLEHNSLERILPKLLEKTLAVGERALVLVGSKERVETLSNSLWVYEPGSWLPHGTIKDGYAEEQPIWLTTNYANPNRASFLFLTDGMTTEFLSDFRRCLEVFDGNDPAMVEIARNHWISYKQAGHELNYWQEKPSGGWEMKAKHTGGQTL